MARLEGEGNEEVGAAASLEASTRGRGRAAMLSMTRLFFPRLGEEM